MKTKEEFFAYQPPAVAFIKEKKRCALFVDPGLGKTIITATAFSDLIDEMEIADPILIVAPPNVSRKTWQNEIRSWMHTHDKTFVYINGSPEKRKKLLQQRACFHIISMELLPWLLRELGGHAPDRRKIMQLLREEPPEHLSEEEKTKFVEDRAKQAKIENKWLAPSKVPYSGIVFDESSKVKEQNTNRWKALSLMAFRVEYFVDLTGTPRPNGLQDLWSQIYLLDRGQRLGHNVTAFRQRWFQEDYDGYGLRAKSHANQAILDKLEDIVYTLREEDYAKLPPRLYNTIRIEMDEETRKKYRKFERTLVLQAAEKEITVTSGASLNMKLRQLSNGVVYDSDKNEHYFHDLKLDALETLVDETYQAPILVAYSFKSDIARIMKRFGGRKGYKIKLYDGKAATEDSWNNGEYNMLLAHENSVAHGLNLQHGGNLIAWFGLTWSLENYMQLNKRLHRTGQQKPVMIHHLVVEGTIDEDALDALEWKENEQEAFLNALKKRIKFYKETAVA